MNNEIFLKIFELLILLLFSLITTFLIPYIKSKINENEIKLFLEYVNIAVKAASQMYTKEQWKEKKEYCMNYLKSIVNDKFTIKLSDDELSTMIEGVLNGLKATGELLIKE